ncbi:P-loop containing nucleoside triphosphate hydrolase protein [Desarmillaria tabescens]|uniref:P-loop containing nucleoside triphosphate hydrolase protein n=1 Tax=Armillaria tabescens TaxID=1929756 RepID=A0AA39NL77_ARMTA|nr:P-loop containing nucleoside triphosphate hydrolase protein [Desarmillaria tabescens]KAK0467707.1 P-loop containing nucleoside triphosphate hydrolase protein [Desarmillaria tabescens]
MQTPRSKQLSILGKRTHRSELSSPSNCEQLQTPDPTPNPKRPKTTVTILDGDDNKENIPPYLIRAVNGDSSSPISARAARTLRRTSTEAVLSSPRRRPVPQRRASTSSLVPPSTPTAGVSHLTISTPPPTPPSLLPIHVRARALLRATCNCIADMPGREKERSAIQNFITVSDNGDQITCLYISGSPGTGKTALVNSLIQSLGTDLNGTKVITINCMALDNVDALWERLSEEFQGPCKRKRSKKTAKGKGRETLEDILSGLDDKCILVLDELDHIASATQSLSAVFSLPACNSSLRIIGIANTHTLTSSTISFSSPVQTLHFPPYTPTQLLLIVQARLAPLYNTESAEEAKRLLPTAPLVLLTKKVAALTGDVRSLFEILRGAIDIAATLHISKDVQTSSSFSVAPAHILAALKAHGPLNKTSPFSSSSTAGSCGNDIASKVKSLGLQARLVLLSVLLSSKRMEASLPLATSTLSSPTKRSQSSPRLPVVATTVEMSQLHVFYSDVLRRGDSDVFVPVSRSEFGDVVSMLEGLGLVSTMLGSKGVKRSFTRTASFTQGAYKGVTSGNVQLAAGVWPEEILRGMGIGASERSVSDDVMEEEVSAFWRRELSRLERDRKNAEVKDLRDPHFADAVQDD